MATRVSLRFPMDQGAKRWMIKYARQKLWCVQDGSYDLDDLIQDGFVTWFRIVERYKNNVDAQKHMMALFQVSFINYINNLAKWRGREKPLACAYDPIMNDLLPDPEMATFYTLCQNAPDEIKKVIRFMENADNCQKLQGLMRLYDDGTRETLGQRLRRLCNLPANVDIVAMLKSYFNHDEPEEPDWFIDNLLDSMFDKAT